MDTIATVPSSILKGLITLFLFYGLTFQTKATHLIGADLKYEWVEDNTYDVYYTVYRDCSGLDIGNTDAVLEIKMDSCGPIIFSRVMSYVGTSVGNPYCSLIGNPCGSTSRTNSQVYNFKIRVNFDQFPNSIGVLTIPRRFDSWLLSVTINARPTIRNVIGSSFNLYTCVTLNNSAYRNPSWGQTFVNNNSPINSTNDFGFRYVCLNQEAGISLAQFDPDGDSLVYELDRPVHNCSTLVRMDTITDSLTLNRIKYPTLPVINQPVLPSYRFVQSSTGPIAVPYYYLDSKSGLLTFTPMHYKPNSSSSLGENKYVISYYIKEFRKDGNRVILAGQTQKDAIIVIEDCDSKTMPSFPNVSLPAGSNAEFEFDSIITFSIPTCNYSKIDINFQNRTGVNQELFLQSGNINSNLGGPLTESVVSSNNTPNVRLSLTLQPDNNLVGRIFNLIVTVKKYDCPITLEKSFNFRFKIIEKNYGTISTPTGTGLGAVCLGDAIALTANPNRPDSSVNAPTMFRYYWDLLPGINQPDANNKVVIARPTIDTRYRVRIANELYNNCIDTASAIIFVKSIPSNQRNLGVNGARAVAQGPNLIYRWYNMWGRIVGTADSFTSHSPGQYYLEVTDTAYGVNCTVRSVSFMLLSSGKFLESPLKLYPNPASGTVKMEGLPIETPLHFVNLVGQRFELNAQTDGLIDISSLKLGLFLVEALFQGKVYRQQLAVEK